MTKLKSGFPEQGELIGRTITIIFNYDPSARFKGVCVRDDADLKGIRIFKLEDGRHVLDNEVQWRATND